MKHIGIWKKNQQKSFEFANKPGRLLANLIKKRKERKWINTMKKIGNGEETSDLKEIQRIFETFYSKLYLKKEVNKKIEQYLEHHLETLKNQKRK